MLLRSVIVAWVVLGVGGVATVEELNAYAHNADFIHEYYIPGHWWCTLQNFYNELKEYDAGTLNFFIFPTVNARWSQCSGPKLGDDDNGKFMKYLIFEFGLLSPTTSVRSDMFRFSGEKVTRADGVTTYEYPPWLASPDTVKVFENYGTLAVAENRMVDLQGYLIVNYMCDGKFPNSVKNKFADIKAYFDALIGHYCEDTDGTLVYNHETTEKPALGVLAATTIATAPVANSDDGLTMPDPYPAAVLTYMTSFAPLQNKYKYHDIQHAVFFATAVNRFYRHGHPSSSKAMSAEEAAVMVAGLFHDVGYILMPYWLAATGQCVTATLKDDLSKQEVVSVSSQVEPLVVKKVVSERPRERGSGIGMGIRTVMRPFSKRVEPLLLHTKPDPLGLSVQGVSAKKKQGLVDDDTVVTSAPKSMTLAKVDCATADHKGHELASLIAVLTVLGAVDTAIKEAIAHVILATKITGIPPVHTTADQAKAVLAWTPGTKTAFHATPSNPANDAANMWADKLLWCVRKTMGASEESIGNVDGAATACQWMVKLVQSVASLKNVKAFRALTLEEEAVLEEWDFELQELRLTLNSLENAHY